jgi:hypothetical protein
LGFALQRKTRRKAHRHFCKSVTQILKESKIIWKEIKHL